MRRVAATISIFLPPQYRNSVAVRQDRILITGGAGFVGRHLRRALPAAFPKAILLPTARGGADGCRPLDMANAVAVADLVAAFRPTACIHLAAVSVVSAARRAPEAAWRINLHGTMALADAIRAQAPECLLLLASSSEIYGRSFAAAGGAALDETALPAPMNLYAATKAAADLALGALAERGLRAVRLRAFNHTGPGQSEEFAVAAFARQVARVAAGLQPPRLAVGPLDSRRDFLDVRDVCAAYIACLEAPEALTPGLILNIASGTPRRIGDILADLLALAGIEADIEQRTELTRCTKIPLTCGDAGLARRLLSWSPRIAWPDTLRAVLDDWRTRVRGAHCTPQ